MDIQSELPFDVEGELLLAPVPTGTPQDRLEEICHACAAAGHPARSVHDIICICGKNYADRGKR